MMSLPLLVLALCARESAAIAETMPRGVAAMHAALDAAASGPAFLDDPHDTAALLLAWSWFESRWDPCAIGDQGRAVGIMQVHGATAAHCDAAAGYAAALQMLADLRTGCGSARGALSAYASGRCDGAKGLVNARCRAAGGIC